VVPLRCRTIDDGQIRLGPVRLEPLTATQEAEAVELLGRLFAAAARRRAEPAARLRRLRRRARIGGVAVRPASTERRRATVVVKSSDLEPAVDRPLGDVCKPFRQPSERRLA
jgi:hypothetical protein